MGREIARELATAREGAAASALETLPAGTWRTLYDVRCASLRMTNVHQIAVGRSGVFVIDTRDWSGDIEVRPDALIHDGDSREATLARVTDSALAVAEAVGLDSAHVVPVLCFARDEPISGWVDGVLVCTPHDLAEQLASRQRVWTASAVEQLFIRLTWALPRVTYRVGEPRGRARHHHRLERSARRRPPTRRRTSRKRAHRIRGEGASTAMRLALTGIACCLALVSVLGRVTT